MIQEKNDWRGLFPKTKILQRQPGPLQPISVLATVLLFPVLHFQHPPGVVSCQQTRICINAITEFCISLWIKLKKILYVHHLSPQKLGHSKVFMFFRHVKKEEGWLSFGLPWVCPWDNHSKCYMGFRGFLVSSKVRHFSTFRPPLGMPLGQSRYMLHGWKEDSMPVKRITACTHLSSTVYEL